MASRGAPRKKNKNKETNHERLRSTQEKKKGTTKTAARSTVPAAPCRPARGAGGDDGGGGGGGVSR